jgi:hypothetical protein
MPTRPYPHWQRRHEAVLLWLLQNPTKSLKLCARETGYSPSQVSRIVNSPDFQQHYRIARDVIRSETMPAFYRRQGGG